VAGKTYTIFIPATGPYLLENTKQRGLDGFLFTNATPVWFDYNGDGEISYTETWVSNHPIRFGNKMMEVTSISTDGSTVTLKESKAPLGGIIFGDRVPEFSLTDQNGEVHTLARYKGKYLILDTWSTTCAPCMASLPKLLELQQELGEDKLQVLLLSVDISWGFADAETRNTATLQRLGIPFPNVLVPGGWNELITTFNIHGYGLILINPDGKAVSANLGHNKEEIYRELNFTPKTTTTQD
jgi:peroxiredoxin